MWSSICALVLPLVGLVVLLWFGSSLRESVRRELLHGSGRARSSRPRGAWLDRRDDPRRGSEDDGLARLPSVEAPGRALEEVADGERCTVVGIACAPSGALVAPFVHRRCAFFSVSVHAASRRVRLFGRWSSSLRRDSGPLHVRVGTERASVQLDGARSRLPIEYRSGVIRADEAVRELRGLSFDERAVRRLGQTVCYELRLLEEGREVTVTGTMARRQGAVPGGYRHAPPSTPYALIPTAQRPLRLLAGGEADVVGGGPRGIHSRGGRGRSPLPRRRVGRSNDG